MQELEWFELTVPLEASDEKMRLDSWLASVLPTVSRSKVQEMIEAGQVLVNRVKVPSGKQIVKFGDQVRYAFLERAKTDLEPIKMDLEILYEDDDVLVINKPAGIAVHRGAGETGVTLVNGLLAHAKTLGRSAFNHLEEDEGLNDRPGIVHRLDKDTTGALVIAKTDHAHAHLSKQFHDKTNFRQYVALLNGKLPEGEWVRESWLFRDPRERTRFASIDLSEYNERRDREGKELQGYRYARTLFLKEASYGPLTLSSIRLYTGRTHQIRVHARDIDAPVFGDQTYGRQGNWISKSPFSPATTQLLVEVKRQFLHAWILGFTHPTSGKWLQFEASLPKDFSNVVEILTKEHVEV